MKLTPIQQSFSAGELSPLMYMRSDTEGYQQGVSELTNMQSDSHGPAVSRNGTRYVGQSTGNNGRIIAIPINENFFYSAFFIDLKLLIGSMVGHYPGVIYNENAGFNDGGTGWSTDTDGNASSSVTFSDGRAVLEIDDKNNRFAQVAQQVTVPTTGDYLIQWAFSGTTPVDIRVGTTEGGTDVYQSLQTTNNGTATVNFTATTLWVSFRIDDDNATDEYHTELDYLGVVPEEAGLVEFVTPYTEDQLDSLQGVPSPSGSSLYILHELHPPYKLTYDPQNDTFAWGVVTFTSPPAEWVEGNYPATGDFFQGRLWLGGTRLESQTFWGSQSGLPEDFTQGTEADDGMTFTLAKFGRITWIIGFKNLLIGTRNGEHIVTAESGILTPSDIQVEQQSAYGSAAIRPVQVGDQIFYVSSDRMKLRAIQYEWQADNWLSRDLTFTSEHITSPGIKQITWHQNPNNLFHCVLTDGSVATMVYDRGNNVYGWSKTYAADGGGKVLDMTTGPIHGTDFANALIQYIPGTLYLETQPDPEDTHFMDSWIDRNPEPDGVTVTGLDHLDGLEVQVLVDQASHPDRTVVGGEITLQHEYSELAVVTVGLQFTSKIVTLPLDKGSQLGSGTAWMKRWNKIYVRLLHSAMPLINGERPPERYPATLMNTPQPGISDNMLVVNLGYGRDAKITIEQDLPQKLVVLGIFGELGQSIT